MTDKKYNVLLTRLALANAKYKELLGEAEKEFTSRYGVHPTDIDYDSWIDTYHVGCGLLTIEQIDKEMKKLKLPNNENLT